MHARGVMVVSVTVLGLLASACSGDRSAADRPAATSPPTSVLPAGENVADTAVLGEPLDTLAPLAQRPSYLPEPVPAVRVTADPQQESAELERRRDELATGGSAAGDDSFTRVAEATPVRFMALTVDVGRRRALNPLRLTRLAALMGVAAHEAVGAAARSEVAPRPDPVDRDEALGAPLAGIDGFGVEVPDTGLPPELVAAVAQQTVACGQLPVECPRFERLGRIALERATASGRFWPSELDAARELGEAVAEATLAHASTDGAAPWNGEPARVEPSGSPDSWVPTPGQFAPALEPLAGTWRPWNLSAPEQFRPPPPPEVGSGEMDAALEQVLELGSNLSDRRLRVVRFWEMGPGTSTPPGYWINDLAIEDLRTVAVADQASALALLSTALFDAGIAIWDAKYTFDLVRPVTLLRSGPSPAWLPSLPTPAHPAYVSGHAGFSAAAAAVLGALIPQNADEYFDAAAEAADSRVFGGIHYWFDSAQGVALGTDVAGEALAQAGVAPVSGVDPIEARLELDDAAARP